MYYYSLSLRQASFLMVNSSWTKGHVDTILQHSDSLLDFLHLLPPFPLLRFLLRRKSHKPPSSARIVYPPCDTREMTKFPLGHRERIILSIAQFRYVFRIPILPRSLQRPQGQRRITRCSYVPFSVSSRSTPSVRPLGINR